MSQNYKPGRGAPSQPALFPAPAIDVHPKARDQVAQLIASNNSVKALDVAKDIHKRCNSAASEALLLDAYGARLASLVERKLDREATALMDLVRERYPSSGERLREWNAAFAAKHGDLSALLDPLTDPLLPAEKQSAIAASVRRDVCDLRSLAEYPTLPPEHPLRTAATALYQAFEAVTTGPVADEALALPEVSRSSPLAPWKMLVRAIAAYYRRDDALCDKFLAAVEPGSAASRLAPSLRALLHQPQTLTPAAAALVDQAGGSLDSLRAILKKLDSALDHRNKPIILQEIHNAVVASRQTEPGLLERLKQHIAVRGMIAGLKPDKVAAAMDGPSLKNAYYWRLLARALEQDKGDPMELCRACSYWEEFRKHAVREGLFSVKGLEAATLYLHMADQLRHVDPDDLESIRHAFARQFDGHADPYRGQPPEVRALMPSVRNADLYFLSSYTILERACEADPSAENFRQWLRHAEKASPATCDRVAERWCAALPKDVSPLLHLMRSAEKRNALQKAFKFMERAEYVDGLNAEVRHARLRLLVSMAVRHLREKKPKLAEKELLQIEALPQAKQGDRPAFVAALRFVLRIFQGGRQEATSTYDEAVRFLGDGSTAQFLFLEVERWCGLRLSSLDQSPKPTVPLFAAFGRVCALGDDMGMTVRIVPPMPEQLIEELSTPNVAANPRALSALGEAALRNDDLPLVYIIAGAGLTQGAESRARFLFLRARSLPPWEQDRCSSCLAAASDLARRQHDSGLLQRIGEWRDELADWRDVPEKATAALGDEEIVRVVQREIAEREFPTSRPNFPDDEDCQCPACCARRGELPPELMEVVDQLGPEMVARALADMLGIGGKKKRGQGRSRLDDFDLPF